MATKGNKYFASPPGLTRVFTIYKASLTKDDHHLSNYHLSTVIYLSIFDHPKPNYMNPDLYSFLLHFHSVIRWVMLLLLLIAIFNSLTAGNHLFTRGDARTGSLLTGFADLMFLIGIVLWYFGPRGYKLIQSMGMSAAMKDPYARFFAIEHITGMVIAIILLHIGKAQGKKAINDRAKHRRTLVFYLLALLIILLSIPWPFRQIGAGSHWY
jgi:hypothetical protein